MKRRLFALSACACLSLLVPSLAHAGIIEWIDRMSGPGPFLGYSFEWRLVCFVEPDSTSQEGDRDNIPLAVVGPGCVFKPVPRQTHRVASVNLHFGLFWDTPDENRLQYRDSTYDEKVRLTTLEPSFWYRPARAVELGFGGGVLWATGPGFDAFHRFYLKPLQVDVKPISLARRGRPYGSWDEFLSLRVGVMVVPKGFASADFGALPGFKVDRDFLKTVSVVAIDLGPLIGS